MQRSDDLAFPTKNKTPKGGWIPACAGASRHFGTGLRDDWPQKGCRKLIEDLKDLSTRRYVSAHAFTWIYLGLGDKDRAFESMQHEYEDRSNCVAWRPVWHLLDGLRSDPRYLDLMRRIGLSQVRQGPFHWCVSDKITPFP